MSRQKRLRSEGPDGSRSDGDSAARARNDAGRRDALVDDSFMPGGASGLELEYPDRIVPYPAWVGHIPFAFWLTEILRPRTIVELGVHTGNSYCALLQAVKALDLETRCFGIDHWQGDEHAGFYGGEVYRELRAYHDPLYGSFSTLVKATFDDALAQFSQGSIDLLHIDGFHTYEAVSRDFTNWLPKMSSRGVVLFHDTNVRERGFGIWKVWEEVAARYRTFEFVHSHGLGMAYVGSAPLPAPLSAVLAAPSDAAINRVRAYFERLGTSLHERFALREAKAEVQTIQARLTELTADNHIKARILRQQMTFSLRLQRNLAELSQQKCESDRDRSRAQERLEELGRENAAAQQRLGEFENQTSLALQRNQDLEQERDLAWQRIRNLEQESGQLKQRIREVEQKSDRAQQRIRDVEQEIDQLRQQKRQVEQAEERLRQQNQDIEQERDRWRQQSHHLGQESDQLRQQNHDLEQQGNLALQEKLALSRDKALAEERLKQILQSTSWRMTALLRSFKSASLRSIGRG